MKQETLTPSEHWGRLGVLANYRDHTELWAIHALTHSSVHLFIFPSTLSPSLPPLLSSFYPSFHPSKESHALQV